MDERYFKDKISAYLDNELSPQERTIVDEYIRTHPEAQVQLEKLESLKRLSKANLSLGGDDLYWERNARKIESAIGATMPMESAVSSRSVWHSHWGKLTAVAASVAILFFIAINRDEVEKKASPFVLPSVEVAKETQQDTVAPILTAQVPAIEKEKRVEKEVQLHKGAEPVPESFELKGQAEEIEVITLAPVSDKFEIASPKVAQKDVSESPLRQKMDQLAPLSKTTFQSVEVAESVSSTASGDSVAEVAVDTVRSLDDWLRIRDSLVTVLEGLRAEREKENRIFDSMYDPRNNPIAYFIDDEGRMIEREVDDPKSPERVWLNANFHIAEITSDLAQKVTSIESLKSYEFHSNIWVRKKALEYLKKLTE